jgi:protein gp37
MGKSAIEWTEETWNPITGCEKVSPGCDNCYAERVALNLQQRKVARYSAGFEPTIHHDLIEAPLRWRKPRMVFVCSMSDLFQPAVGSAVASKIIDVMAEADSHTFQILTKRPKRMKQLLNTAFGRTGVPAHIWVGTSVESNEYVWRAEVLHEIPAAVRFVSVEPLLGPVDQLDVRFYDWVIVGGESGKEARPMHPDWVRDLRDRSLASPGTAFFFKQWGEWVPTDHTDVKQVKVAQYRYEPASHVFTPTGTRYNPREPNTLWQPGMAHMLRVGRKRAGRLLDGVEWNEMPSRTTGE